MYLFSKPLMLKSNVLIMKPIGHLRIFDRGAIVLCSSLHLVSLGKVYIVSDNPPARVGIRDVTQACCVAEENAANHFYALHFDWLMIWLLFRLLRLQKERELSSH